MTMTELASALKLPLSTTTHTVSRLEAKGLVERRQAKQDRRIVHVRFSRRGQRINAFVVESRRRIAEAMLGSLSARERDTMLERLATMVEARAPSPEDAESFRSVQS